MGRGGDEYGGPEKQTKCLHAGCGREIGLHYSLGCPATRAAAHGLCNGYFRVVVSEASLVPPRAANPGCREPRVGKSRVIAPC